MRVTSFAIKIACFAVSASLSTSMPASAEGDPSYIVPVHRDPDGSLWYSYGDGPGIKVFITIKKPCWIDHDHVRISDTMRAGCADTRP